jgi:hypothetical protein
METTGNFIKNCKRRACVVTLLVFIAIVPALADVDIIANLTEELDGVIISFDATSEPNLVRAFALDIRLDHDVNIIEVTALNPDYYIFPGTIQIDAMGNIIDYGTPVGEYNDLPSGTLPGLDSNGVTIEMASLYAPVGPGSPNAPARSGPLVSISIIGDYCLTVSPNITRAGPTGVVMENPDEVVKVNFPDPICFYFCSCLKYTDPGYDIWVQYGKFDCWCYRHQCQGDTDGLATFGRYVALADLNYFKAGFGKTLEELAGELCCDFNHTMTFGRPCGLDDLNILKANFGVMGLPDCPMTHINYWIEP